MQQTTERLLLKGGEVAEACNMSRAQAYKLMAAGVLPVVRIPGSKSVRVPKAELEKWIKNNTQEVLPTVR
jgi:excisionase family DNA binding protein